MGHEPQTEATPTRYRGNRFISTDQCLLTEIEPSGVVVHLAVICHSDFTRNMIECGDQSKPSPSITDLWLQAKRVQSVRTPLTPYILLHSVQTKRIYQAATDRLTFRRLNLMASVTSLGFRNCNVEGKQLQDSKQTERLPGRDRTGAAFQFNEINSLVTETRLTRRSHRSKTRRKSANSNEKLQCQNGPESGRK